MAETGAATKRRKGLYVLITASWVVMMGLLFHRDVLPAIPRRTAGHMDFRHLLSQTPLPYTSRMGIYLGDKKVGYVQTSIEPESGGWYRLTTLANAEAPLPFSTSIRFRIFAETILDENSRLRSLELSFTSPVYRANVSGTVDRNQLELVLEREGTRETLRVPISPGHILSNSLFPFLRAPSLKTGSRWSMNFFNPITLQAERVEARVTDTEEIEFGGHKETTHIVVINYAGQELKAWVTKDGEVLRQETSLGLKLVREEDGDNTE